MKLIPLYNRKGEIVDNAIVSEEDFDIINVRRWFKSARGYALSSDNGKEIRMHRVVFERTYGRNPDRHIDHKDRNKINNQRDNLRSSSHSGNMLNRDLRKDNTIGYRGVSQDNRTGGYWALGRRKGKQKYIGAFTSKIDAAIARDLWAKDNLDPEFIVLNVPDASSDDVCRVRQMLDNPKKTSGISRFLGVSLDKRRKESLKPWFAQIYKQGERHFIGCYSSQEEAAIAYNIKAKELLGDKAKLNKV